MSRRNKLKIRAQRFVGTAHAEIGVALNHLEELHLNIGRDFSNFIEKRIGDLKVVEGEKATNGKRLKRFFENGRLV